MKTIQKILVLVGLIYFTTSCSDNEQLSEIVNLQKSVPTELNSTLNLIKGYGDISPAFPQTKSNNGDIVIDSYEVTTYSFPISQNTLAKSVTKDSTDINLYYVTFSK